MATHQIRAMVVVLAAAFGSRTALAAPPLAEVPDFAVRVRVVKAGGEAPAAGAAFSLGVAGAKAIPFSGGDWSPWVESAREGIAAALAGYPNSYNRRWEVRIGCAVQPVGSPFANLHLEVETRIAGAETNRTPAELHGPALGLILWRDEKPGVHVDTLAGHGRRVHDAAMREAVLPPRDRPKRILFGERFIGGAPALTVRTVKRGRVFRFAGYPGLCYRRSATEKVGGLPAGFASGWRNWIVGPVRSAGVVLPVAVDRPLVEAPALYSVGGVAVTLLNWSGAAQRAVTVVVRTERRPARCRFVSRQQGKERSPLP